MFFRNIAEFLAPIAPKVKHRLKKYENTFAYNTLKNTWKWFVNSSLVTGNLRRYVEKQQMIQDKYDLTELKKAEKNRTGIYSCGTYRLWRLYVVFFDGNLF